MMPWTVGAASLAVISAMLVTASGARGELAAFEVRDDAVTEPLAGLVGNAARGRDIIVDQRKGNCLICHAIPSIDAPFQGKIGPSLARVARRLGDGRIRLRLIDQSLINPQTIMPPYYRTTGLRDVAPAYRGKPALSAQEIEDVVAYLVTLKE